MVRLSLFLGASALALALALPGPAAAQSDSAAQSLIDRLRPSTGSGSRGIRVPTDQPAAAAPTAPAPVWRPAPSAAVPHAAPAPQVAARPAPVRETTADAPSVSITVTFASGSAALTPEAERALAPLGRALASPELAPYRFRIEGHTDTVGDAAVNQALSERRAAAVREYLSRVYHVDPNRLVAVGFGSTQLLVQTGPQVPDPRNRRVQVVNLGN
ncbi:OmpA family protein [Siccirubricoccus phaeus]|uniref:OmpA family protein n=1 Tax=Siccirubricoccus phaeus TaxID=2595053 RepID=UPI0011F2280A|nr:OmpA family protein [Siccirubricoccus phaeus]